MSEELVKKGIMLEQNECIEQLKKWLKKLDINLINELDFKVVFRYKPQILSHIEIDYYGPKQEYIILDFDVTNLGKGFNLDTNEMKFITFAKKFLNRLKKTTVEERKELEEIYDRYIGTLNLMLENNGEEELDTHKFR